MRVLNGGERLEAEVGALTVNVSNEPTTAVDGIQVAAALATARP